MSVLPYTTTSNDVLYDCIIHSISNPVTNEPCYNRGRSNWSFSLIAPCYRICRNSEAQENYIFIQSLEFSLRFTIVKGNFRTKIEEVSSVWLVTWACVAEWIESLATLRQSFDISFICCERDCSLYVKHFDTHSDSTWKLSEWAALESDKRFTMYDKQVWLSTNTAYKQLRWSRGSVLAFGTHIRGFKPGRSRRKGSKAVCTMSHICGM